MPQNSNQQSDGQQVIAKDLNNVMDLMNHEAVSYQKTKVYSQQVRSDDAKQLWTAYASTISRTLPA